MKKYNLNIASPTDGRYATLCDDINKIFSEHNLIKTRVKVEIEWLIFLSNLAGIRSLPKYSVNQIKTLRGLYLNFNNQDSKRVKRIEETTKHDVKAVEYFIKEKIKSNKNIYKHREHIHICCTSEDINNVAYALMLKDAREILLFEIDLLQKKLKVLSKRYKNLPILSHTHGQPASPSTMGKEFINFQKRLLIQIDGLKEIKIKGKFNGATGNYSAHSIAYPNIDWPKNIKRYLSSLNIELNSHTTQIEPHDYIAELCNRINHINSILIGFTQDIWSYISKGYFTQKNISGEIGSSTMPHKINPINFENAEGNLGMSNTLSHFFANKLTISRLQRDLSDSTVLRNLGLTFAYSIIAYKNILIGLNKLDVNKDNINKDIDNSWEILAEPIQMVARKYHIPDSYEYLKKYTRGKKVNQEIILKIINSLNIPQSEKNNLAKLTPRKYIGYASKLCDE
jgi:adenylosuccinate lyase